VKLSRGVLYMAASAFGFSAMAMLVKVASTRLPTGEIMFARAIVTLTLSYAMLRREGLSPWGTHVLPLVFRGLLGFGGMTCYYLSLARLPLADAITLQNVTPLITAWLAWWLLDERVGWSTAIAVAFGLGGVILIVHPDGAGLDLAGVAAALGGVGCSSIAYVTVRKLAHSEHPLVIVFYFPLIATPLALPWMLASLQMPAPTDWLLLVAIGVVTQFAQVFLTRGLALERAGRAASVGYLQVAFALVWQLVIFGDLPTRWTLAGASLILGGTLVVAQVTRLRALRWRTRRPSAPAPTSRAP
jgi:drug/metabolite transporter (DMT)-like permease